MKNGALPLRWDGEALVILDQRLLPGEERFLRLASSEQVFDAIRTLAVRGAPLLGVATAYGMALAAREGRLEGGAARLRSARPTAVNVPRAVDRCLAVAAREPGSEAAALLLEAQRLEQAEREAADAICSNGAQLLRDVRTVMTICNTGALGTGPPGTALGIVLRLSESARMNVICCETRPLLQGARLTAWELSRAGIPCTLIVDGAAAAVLRSRKVDAIIVGCDRLAVNGDLVNKVGTYGLALAAATHGVPFVVAATASSIDEEVATGDLVAVEERDATEVLGLVPGLASLAGVAAFNPAFDVTPAELITAVVTERGTRRREDDPRGRLLGRAPATRN